MTKAEAQAARARCEAATEGPWVWDAAPWVDYDRDKVAPWLTGDDGLGPVITGDGIKAEERDAELIAHARTDLPAALDMLNRCVTTIGALKFPRGDVYEEGVIEAEKLLREWEGR